MKKIVIAAEKNPRYSGGGGAYGDTCARVFSTEIICRGVDTIWQLKKLS